MNYRYSEANPETRLMPLCYSPNYQIIWMAENFCKYKSGLTPQAIIKEVGQIFSISTETLLSKNKKMEVLTPRQIAIYASMVITGESKTELGRIFQRDHTSIIHALKTVKNYIKTKDPQFGFYWAAYTSESKIYQYNQ